MKWRVIKSQANLWDLIFDMNGLGIKLGYITHGATDLGDNYWLYIGDQVIYRASELNQAYDYFTQVITAMASAEVCTHGCMD